MTRILRKSQGSVSKIECFILGKSSGGLVQMQGARIMII